MLTGSCFTEEGVEGIVSSCLVTWHVTIRLHNNYITSTSCTQLVTYHLAIDLVHIFKTGPVGKSGSPGV